MNTSPSTAKIAAAIAQVQGALRAIAKDAENPHFRSRYATLGALMEAVRPALAEHELALVAGCSRPLEHEGRLVGFALETRLLHSSGEWVASTVFMPVAKMSPQDAGSALTYARRYSLAALLSLAVDDDDDGEAATAPSRTAPATRRASPRPASATPLSPTPMTDKQRELLARLAASSAFTDKERAGLLAITEKARATQAIDWATAELDKRKAATGEDAA